MGTPTSETLSFAGLRTQLRDGQWSTVAEALSAALQTSQSNVGFDRDEVLRVIRYITQHGEAGHLDYPKFSLMGLPLGSGSIESAIRRVVNLRMKGNGTFWRVSKAERILVLRSSILSGRWDKDREKVKIAMQQNQKIAMPTIRDTTISTTDARLKSLDTQQIH